MNQKGFAVTLILAAILLLVLVGGGVYYLTTQKNNSVPSLQQSAIQNTVNVIKPSPSFKPTVSSDASPSVASAPLESTESTQPQASCKHENESICINPFMCPNNNEKCCKGLFAVIETKSNVTCQASSNENENSTKPRVKNLEQ